MGGDGEGGYKWVDDMEWCGMGVYVRLFGIALAFVSLASKLLSTHHKPFFLDIIMSYIYLHLLHLFK